MESIENLSLYDENTDIIINFKEKVNLNNVNFDELNINDSYEISINNFDPNCPLRQILGNVEINILHCIIQKDNEILIKEILDCFKSNSYLYDEDDKILRINTNLHDLVK